MVTYPICILIVVRDVFDILSLSNIEIFIMESPRSAASKDRANGNAFAQGNLSSDHRLAADTAQAGESEHAAEQCECDSKHEHGWRHIVRNFTPA